jgi:hypothetical protein
MAHDFVALERLAGCRIRSLVSHFALLMPTLDLGKLREKKAWDLAIRFGFGGAVTVTTELIARTFGPEIAGLFLAFPAILPASLTLIRQNEGPAAAAKDALGAAAGSISLSVFATCVWKGVGAHPAASVLFFAAILWIVAGGLLWWIFLSRTSEHGLR